MDRLVRALVSARRIARGGFAMAVSATLGVGVVQDASIPFETPIAIAAGLSWLFVLVWSLGARLRAGGKKHGAFRDLEIGVLLVVAVFAALGRIEGGLSSPLYPVVYVLVAAVSAFAEPLAVTLTVAMLVTLEGSVRYVALGERGFAGFVAHGAFVSTFAALNVVFLRAELARVRARARVRLETEIGRMRDAARSYRLLGAPKAPSDASPAQKGDEERLVRSSVEEIHQAVLFALEVLRGSLDLHTALLLWNNDAGTHVRISELSTDSDAVCEGPFLSGDGIIGAVMLRRASVMLDGLKPGYKLPYYAGTCPVRAVCGVPVVEHGAVRGVLLVDRLQDRAFTPREEQLLCDAARHVARAIQNERVFVQLERAKVEQGKLYRAAQALGAALTESDVVEAAVKSAREVALFDFAAVTLFDEATRAHEIRAVSGEGAELLVGERFSHNASLCAMVVHNRYSLPYKGDFDPAHHVLFSKRLSPPSMPSLLVLPLLVHDHPLGTLVLGARRRGAFGDAVRPTLEVLASHMAVSLANARMLRKLEELATTDGLTGLLNKRAMLEVAKEKVAAAVRFSRRLSILVTDIDLFKRVNDTHGHDVGDMVIRGMGDILRRAKRTTDAVARFGGEEFILICEETDAAGAMLLAERVRKEIECKTFVTPRGPLKITCSLGIATFPEAGRDWDALFKAADEALYASKRAGRNRSIAWTPLQKCSAA
jgi:two-component system, cell cycle response regulator